MSLVAHTGFEPVISSLRGRCPKPLDECAPYDDNELRSSQKLTEALFAKFLQPRPHGISRRTVEGYHYTLTKFIGYPLTTEGITQYLDSLTRGNGKLKFYSCLRSILGWLHQNNHIQKDIKNLKLILIGS
jgi:hypothetical protein